MNLFLTPEALLLGWTILLLLIECFFPALKTKTFGVLSMLGVGLVFISTWFIPPAEPVLFAKLYMVDGIAFFLKHLILIATFFTLWMFYENSERYHKTLFVFPLFAAIGGVLLSSAADFITLFVSLELVTVALYILIASQKQSAISLEAGVKYLIMGALSAAFFIFGIALLYNAVGSMHFSTIAHRLSEFSSINLMVYLSIILIVASLGFKIAAVPFHAWAPDVYEGAPTPVTAFLSIASKAMAFLLFFRIFWLNVFGVSSLQATHQNIFTILAIASLALGNLAAIPQQNIKRLFGYSSIAHAGFLIAALSCFNDRGATTSLVYLIAYALATLLIFLLINFLEDEIGTNIKDYAGLAKKSPIAAFSLLVAFISLAGLPPAVGFFAKFGVLAALWQNGQLLLFIVALLCTLIGLYYYLNLIRTMYYFEPAEKNPVHTSFTTWFCLGLAFLIFLLGFWPAPILHVVDSILLPIHLGGTVTF